MAFIVPVSGGGVLPASISLLSTVTVRGALAMSIVLVSRASW